MAGMKGSPRCEKCGAFIVGGKMFSHLRDSHPEPKVPASVVAESAHVGALHAAVDRVVAWMKALDGLVPSLAIAVDGRHYAVAADGWVGGPFDNEMIAAAVAAAHVEVRDA